MSDKNKELRMFPTVEERKVIISVMKMKTGLTASAASVASVNGAKIEEPITNIKIKTRDPTAPPNTPARIFNKNTPKEIFWGPRVGAVSLVGSAATCGTGTCRFSSIVFIFLTLLFYHI